MKDPGNVPVPVFRAQQRTIDFSAVPGFKLVRLLAITNLDARQDIYDSGDSQLGFTAVNGAVITLAYDTRAMDDGDALQIFYEDGTAVLPANAATADRQDTSISRLVEIRDAIRAQRVETIWTDDTGTRFIRLDSGGTITWTDVAGNPSTAPGTGARPDSDSGTVVSRSTFRATATGTGFATGDILDHLVVTDGDAGDLVSNFWINVTAGTKITAPSAASITPLAPLPDGASTAARQDTTNTTLSTLSTGVGTPADADPGSDAAAGSIIALLRRGLGRWSTFLSRFPAALGPATAAGSISVTLPADGQFTASVGLPADAAAASDSAAASLIALTKRELAASTAGNTSLASIATTSNGTSGSTAALNTATGAKTDAATASGADTSVIGALRAIRDRLLGTLNTTLATGSNVIGAVTQSGTWAANATLQAGSAIVGRVGIDQTTPGTTNGVVVNSSALPAGAALDATLTARLGTLGQKAMAGSAPVVIASDQAPLPTTIRSAGTNRSASVGTAAVTLMPANAGRQGWKIKNDSAGDIWINFDATATAAAGSGNIRIPSGAYISSEPGFVETGAMSAIGSAASLAITAREH